jgi:hypothetical protein
MLILQGGSMRKVLFIGVFGFCTLLFAQDQDTRRNAIGWEGANGESGITYRRYLNDKLWIGVTLGGSIYDTRGKDTLSTTYVFTSPDSTASNTIYSDDTSKTYSGTIKVAIGREIMRIHNVSVDAFFSGGYTYVTGKDLRTGTNGSNYNNPSNTLTGIIGLEPKVWIWNRINVGTQLGLQYDYQWYHYNRFYTYQNSTSSYSQTDNQRSTENNLRVFGSISLSMGLNVYFLF